MPRESRACEAEFAGLPDLSYDDATTIAHQEGAGPGCPAWDARRESVTSHLGMERERGMPQGIRCGPKADYKEKYFGLLIPWSSTWWSRGDTGETRVSKVDYTDRSQKGGGSLHATAGHREAPVRVRRQKTGAKGGRRPWLHRSIHGQATWGRINSRGLARWSRVGRL